MTDVMVYTQAQRPELRGQRAALQGVWPAFMLEDELANLYWDNLYTWFADFQFYLCDAQGSLIAEGNTIPVVWDGTLDGLPDRGWDWALESGMQGYTAGIPPTTLCALSATISRERQGSGLSRRVIEGMRTIAARHGLNALIAPVRPSLKARYPLTPMQRYIGWKRDDGTLFDPWLRTHARLGAALLKVCPESMLIRNTVAAWETWTEMTFPESGIYVVPGALSPIHVDREADEARYVEPNVWMRHEVNWREEKAEA